MDRNLKKDRRLKFTFLNSFRIAIVGATILHILFLVIFLIKGVIPLVIFNICSIILFIYFSIYYIKKNVVLATIISFIEVTAQTLFCTYYIGWDSGFYVYPLCMIPIIYFVTVNILKKEIYGHILVIATFIIYQLAKVFADYRIAQYEHTFIPINDELYKFNTVNASFLFAFLVYAFLSEMRDTQEALEDKNEILKDIANIDMLTGINNRRYMSDKLREESEMFKQNNKPFSIAICDIDDFKKINDIYGHDCGDIVLKEIANILKLVYKEYDIEICRWGGEEFLILLRETILEAEKICQIILKIFKLPYLIIKKVFKEHVWESYLIQKNSVE